MQLTHGGDWFGFYSESTKMPLDFSANVSPLGLPKLVQAAAIRALEMADRYPDPLCRALRQRISDAISIKTDHILCGNGAADLIFRLAFAKKPNRALVTAPTFSEYEQALGSAGCAVRHHLLREADGFAVTESLIDEITPDIDILFLCEPNNPTGRTTEPALLRRILTRCEECGTLLCVDECFNPFLEYPEAHTLLPLIEDHPQLIILRAFTKWFGMAGLRLGLAVSSDERLLERMTVCGQPWSVSTVSQAAGIAALDDMEYSARLRRLILAERDRLTKALRDIGLFVYPGEANYLLFACSDGSLARKLRSMGILIRDCSNYVGLGAGYYRIAVRTEQENDRLISALKGVLQPA